MSIETPTKGRGSVSKMTVSPMASLAELLELQQGAAVGATAGPAALKDQVLDRVVRVGAGQRPLARLRPRGRAALAGAVPHHSLHVEQARRHPLPALLWARSTRALPPPPRAPVWLARLLFPTFTSNGLHTCCCSRCCCCCCCCCCRWPGGRSRPSAPTRPPATSSAPAGWAGSVSHRSRWRQGRSTSPATPQRALRVQRRVLAALVAAAPPPSLPARNQARPNN